MKLNFVSLLKSETGKDTAALTFGTIINALVGGIFFIIAPRVLGPDKFGMFSTVVSTALLFISVSNFGIDTGILKFAKRGTNDFFKILSLAFNSYLILGFLVVILGYFLSPLISTFLKEDSATNLLRIGFTGSIFILFTNFFTAALQAKGKYNKSAITGIVGNVSRLLILILFIYFVKINLIWLTIIFFITPVFSVITGYLLMPLKYEKVDFRDFGKFFKFNSWIAIALVISSIPLDNYILINNAGAAQTGIYAAPFKLLTFAYMIGGNFTRVLASRFTSFDSNEKAKTFALKSLPFVIFFSLLILVSIPFSKIIVSTFLSNQYAGSADIYSILAFGFIAFFLSTIPSSLIIYYFGRSNVSLLITVVKYALFAVLLILLTPNYLAVGAAIAFTVVEVFALILMTSYSYIRLKN